MARRPTPTRLSRSHFGINSERKAFLKSRLPYLSLTNGPDTCVPQRPEYVFDVATYNVHRWAGPAGGRRWNPSLAADVIAELDADVIALQEVLRPFRGRDPLAEVAGDLGLHVAFVSTRVHRFGELGNVILSRWPMSFVFTIDLSLSRFEQRSAVVAAFEGPHTICVAATHLALVDRTRRRQVISLLKNERLQGPAVLLGDMNAWRRCRATKKLDQEFATKLHDFSWPASFPAPRPVLALDRIYAREARVTSLRAHSTPAARRASDHLPVLATIELDTSCTEPGVGCAPGAYESVTTALSGAA